jgi:hypothetical protein
MDSEFAAFILTHGRPDRVKTYKTLRKQGYTGRMVLLVDNEDEAIAEYKKTYGDEVYVFNKRDIASRTDSGDNFETYRGVIYARNVNFEVATELGIKYFIQLDDDYTDFRYRKNDQGLENTKGVHYIKNMDNVFTSLLNFYKNTNITSVAMAQGGDFIGGKGKAKPSRKVMNSFVCGTDRPFKFVGRINEDVNTYALLGSQGHVFLTTMWISLQQTQTQSNSGGMTELYLDNGTYVKSFYSVIYQPSSVSVNILKDRKNPRLHHRVKWRNTVPMILSESVKKGELPCKE